MEKVQSSVVLVLLGAFTGLRGLGCSAVTHQRMPDWPESPEPAAVPGPQVDLPEVGERVVHDWYG